MMVANGGQGGKGGVLSDPVLAFPSSEEEGELMCVPQPHASEYIRGRVSDACFVLFRDCQYYQYNILVAEAPHQVYSNQHQYHVYNAIKAHQRHVD